MINRVYTNINIKGPNGIFNYILEYNELGNRYDEVNYSIEGDIYCNNSQWIQDGYKWRKNEDFINTNICSKIAELTLYFPQYSIETYNPHMLYILTASTWVHGKRIFLGSFLLDRSDALASSRIKSFYNIDYCECVKMHIIDPKDLIYADAWKEFRTNMCGEIDGAGVNSVGSVLYFTLHPVIKSDDYYILSDEYHGGQNSINISNKDSDFLNLSISSNTDASLGFREEPSIICNLNFNNEYDGDLSNYMFETYGITDFSTQYGLTIGNENELYLSLNSDLLESNNTKYAFKKSVISPYFENGVGWKEGINIRCSIDIIKDGESIIYLLSNSIPLTKDIFKYFTKENFVINKNIIHNINLDSVDMNVYNINAVNKIQNNVIQVNRDGDSKSKIMQTVFFRSTDSSDIIIHKGIVETICINLSKYASKVDSFTIQINGIKFNEIGRISQGSLFEIDGRNVIENGTYYILNSDSKLVTSGKYIVE